MSALLTARVKRKLNITWEDEVTNARVDDIMDDVDPYLRHKLGVSAEFDFSTPGTERDLFLSCCLYEWNHIPRDEWEENYKHTIANLRDRYAVENYLKEKEAQTDAEA
jgi:hypothetical protein